MSILNTSVSGMGADQNWLASISQNVANSTTTGYKGIETEFSTMVDQVPGGPYEGAGVQTTTISYNALQGGVVSSTTTTNLAVQGAGFFVVSDSAGNLYLTRNGSFVPDSSGNLVNSSGLYLMASNIQNGQTVSANSLGSLQKVNVESSGLTAVATTTGSLSANLPSTATPTTFAAPTAGPPATAAVCTDQTSIVVYDSLGAAHTVNLYFTNTGAAGPGRGRSTPTKAVDLAGHPDPALRSGHRRAGEYGPSTIDLRSENALDRPDDHTQSRQHDPARHQFHRVLRNRQRQRPGGPLGRLDRQRRDPGVHLLEWRVGQRL